MNVLFLDQFGKLGGAQRCLLDLLPAIAARGWTARGAIPVGGGLEAGFRAAGVPVDAISSGPYTSTRKTPADFFRFAGEMPRLVARIGEIVKARGIDLLYVNGPRVLPAAAVVARRRGLRLLFHCHVHLDQRAAVRAAGWALKLSRASVIACCRFAAEPVRPYVRPERLHVVYNGVPDVAREGLRGKRPPRVGVVGRVEPDKGQLDFVRAARMLAAEFPKLRYAVIGGPLFSGSEYFDRVRAAADGLPVDFPGWSDDVAEALSSLDVLAAPSFERDPNPRVILEAFSAGVPVVAYPSPGIAEVIEDGVCGFLTRERGPEALAERIRDVLLDEAGREEAVRRAREEWERWYTLERYGEQITGLMA